MNLATSITDDALLRRLQNGEEEAFVELYQRWQGAVYRFALHMTGLPALAEDVTQEVFMHVLRQPNQFDATRGTFGAYATGVARNMTLKALESNHRYVTLPDGEEEFMAASLPVIGGNGNGSNGTSMEMKLAREQQIAQMRHAVLALPLNYREVVVLCELQEMSYEEAAEILECPIGTVRSRLHRARLMLAERLRRGAGDLMPSAVAGRVN